MQGHHPRAHFPPQAPQPVWPPLWHFECSRATHVEVIGNPSDVGGNLACARKPLLDGPCGEQVGARKSLLSKASAQAAVPPCFPSVAIWPVPESHCFQEGICSDFMRSRCGNLACARKPLLAARVCAIEPALSDGAVESDERNLQVHDRRSEFAQDFGVFQG